MHVSMVDFIVVVLRQVLTYVDQSGLKLMEIDLPLPLPPSPGIKSVHHHTCYIINCFLQLFKMHIFFHKVHCNF